MTGGYGLAACERLSKARLITIRHNPQQLLDSQGSATRNEKAVITRARGETGATSGP